MPSVTNVDSPTTLARFHAELTFADGIARRARRQLGLSLPLEDLTSFAREALLRASRSFDDGHGIPFRAWASLRVRGAILDGVRKHGVLPRRAFERFRAEAAAASSAEAAQATSTDGSITPGALKAEEDLTEYLTALASMMSLRIAGSRSVDGQSTEDSDSPEEQLSRAEMWAAVRAAMKQLPEVERTLLERYYMGDVTLDEASRSLGLSKSWGSRLHARAVQSLARDLKHLSAAA